MTRDSFSRTSLLSHCTLRLGLVMMVLAAFNPPPLLAHNNPGYNHDDSAVGDHPNWMAQLPNDLKLSQISIPGTHDTMSFFGGGLGDIVITQSMPLRKQLNSGIRALDIRARHIEDVFAIHHGPVFQEVFFGEVLRIVGEFLDANPTETVLMRLGDAGVPEAVNNTRRYNDTFRWYKTSVLHGNKFYDPLNYVFDPEKKKYDCAVDPNYTPTPAEELIDGGCLLLENYIPTLGEVRGKIVVLQNFDSCSGELGQNADCGGQSGLMRVWHGPSYASGNFRIQDDFSFGTNWDLHDKWAGGGGFKGVKVHLNEANGGAASKIYVNYLSGAKGSFPYFVASGHSDPRTNAPRLATGLVSNLSCFGCYPDFPRVACWTIWNPFGDDPKLCTVAFEGTNILAMNHIRSRGLTRTGIVMADFPGKGLIEAVVNANPDVDLSRPNRPPEANAGPQPYVVDEGSQVTFDASGSSDPDGDRLGYAWSPWEPSPSPAPPADLPFPSNLCARDGGEGFLLYEQAFRAWLAANHPEIGPDDEIPEAVLVGFAASDEGREALMLLGGEAQSDVPTATYTCFDDLPNGGVTVRVTDHVLDDYDSQQLTVRNVDPTVQSPASKPPRSDEGSSIVASADFMDPAFDAPTETFTCTVDYGDGDGPLEGMISGNACTGPAHTYADNGVYTIIVEVTDDDGGVGSASRSHTVDNVAPTVISTFNSAAICGATPEGTSVDVWAEFSDPGFDKAIAGSMEDFANSTIDWGDGTVELATVAEVPGAAGVPTTGRVSGRHVYATGGIYNVTITVVDDDGGLDATTHRALVTGTGLAPGGLLGVIGTDLQDSVRIRVKKGTFEIRARVPAPDLDNDSDGDSDSDCDSDSDSDSDGSPVRFPIGDVVSLEVRVCGERDRVCIHKTVTAPAILVGGTGSDLLRGGDGPSTLIGGPEADRLFCGNVGSVADGGGGDDHLRGGDDSDRLFGREGDDKLFGKKGDDLLDGGPGADHCNGGQGADTLLNCNETCEAQWSITLEDAIIFGTEVHHACESVAARTTEVLGEATLMARTIVLEEGFAVGPSGRLIIKNEE